MSYKVYKGNQRIGETAPLLVVYLNIPDSRAQFEAKILVATEPGSINFIFAYRGSRKHMIRNNFPAPTVSEELAYNQIVEVTRRKFIGECTDKASAWKDSQKSCFEFEEMTGEIAKNSILRQLGFGTDAGLNLWADFLGEIEDLTLTVLIKEGMNLQQGMFFRTEDL